MDTRAKTRIINSPTPVAMPSMRGYSPRAERRTFGVGSSIPHPVLQFQREREHGRKMSLRNLFRMVGLAVAVATTGQVQAGFINNSSGLSNPSTTITFDEFVFSAGTSITTQYSTLNVTFSPKLVYDAVTLVAPNISGHRLGNQPGIFPPYINPFSIKFSSLQSDVAFAMTTDPTTTTFEAFNNGVLSQF